MFCHVQGIPAVLASFGSNLFPLHFMGSGLTIAKHFGCCFYSLALLYFSKAWFSAREARDKDIQLCLRDSVTYVLWWVSVIIAGCLFGYWSVKCSQVEIVASQTWQWTIGIIYIIAVALIWIAASFVVQSVVDSGVSPFLITYICNSLFVVYLPIVEVGRCLEASVWKIWFQCAKEHKQITQLEFKASENVNLLQDDSLDQGADDCHKKFGSASQIPPAIVEPEGISKSEDGLVEVEQLVKGIPLSTNEKVNLVGVSIPKKVDEEGHWTRTKTAKISLLICPFWFLAQLTFNLSLKYTTVTSNTILSSTSSLFTFLVSLVILDEKFTWVKLSSVLLCMVGTIIVSLGDSETGKNEIATHPLLGDFLCLVSGIFYALYTTLIRKKVPSEEKGGSTFSTAQFLGFLGMFNMIIFLPVALILHFTKVEPFHTLTLMQFGLIIGKDPFPGLQFFACFKNLKQSQKASTLSMPLHTSLRPQPSVRKMGFKRELLLQKPPTTAGAEGKPFLRYFEAIEAMENIGARLSQVEVLLEGFLHQYCVQNC
eukprot:Gb_41553 [translate_table: standard]